MARDFRALIVDDEEPARARLKRMLAVRGGIDVVGEAVDGLTAIEAITTLNPDLVFLDVQMPNGDGFTVVDTIGPFEMPPVVFVTAHDEHALRAFDARAIDYLLKPVREERLHDALERVHSRSGGERARRLSAAVDIGVTRPFLTRVVVRDGDRQIPIVVDAIDWIQADRNDVWVHIGQRSFLLRRSIGAILPRLDPRRFAQVNRSAIVRIDAVRELAAETHGDYAITLADGASVVWSRRFRARAPNALGEHFGR